MSIQWFPGHMAKARRQIEEKLPLIDIVIEVVDARVPQSSRNPMLDEILKKKPRLMVFMKRDLADESVTQEWKEHFESEGVGVVLVDAMKKTGIKDIVPKCKEQLKERIERDLARGLKQRPIRALIVGIPNAGKSTLINRLVGRKAANIGNRPGITKSQQWVKIAGELELLDTPGILWPKFEDPKVGLNLAATGAIKESILPKDEVAIFILEFLAERYQNRLKERYNVETFERDFVIDVYDSIGKRRGCIVSGGEIDYEKVSDLICKDVIEGHLGRLSFERPSDFE